MTNDAAAAAPDSAPSKTVVEGVNVIEGESHSDAFIIGEMRDVGAHMIRRVHVPSERVQLACVGIDGLALRIILRREPDASPAVRMAALRENGMSLEFIIDDATPAEIDAAYRQSHNAFDYIDTPDVRQSLALIEAHGASVAINYDVELSHVVSLALVRSDGMVIGRLVKPGEEVQLAAVEENAEAVGQIDKEVLTERVMLAAVAHDADAVRAIDRAVLTERVMLAAVTRDGLVLACIAAVATAAVRMAALRHDWRAIQHIVVPMTHELREALRTAQREGALPGAIELIGATRLPVELCRRAIDINTACLSLMDDRDDAKEPCMAAVRTDWRALAHVSRRHVTPEMQEVAVLAGAPRTAELGAAFDLNAKRLSAIHAAHDALRTALGIQPGATDTRVEDDTAAVQRVKEACREYTVAFHTLTVARQHRDNMCSLDLGASLMATGGLDADAVAKRAQTTKARTCAQESVNKADARLEAALAERAAARRALDALDGVSAERQPLLDAVRAELDASSVTVLDTYVSDYTPAVFNVYAVEIRESMAAAAQPGGSGGGLGDADVEAARGRLRAAAVEAARGRLRVAATSIQDARLAPSSDVTFARAYDAHAWERRALVDAWHGQASVPDARVALATAIADATPVVTAHLKRTRGGDPNGNGGSGCRLDAYCACTKRARTDA
jgi:hypothetical protein